MPRRLEGRGSLEVFVTKAGQIAIKQEDCLGNDDAVVILDANDVSILVRWLQEAAADAEQIRQMNAEAALDDQIEA